MPKPSSFLFLFEFEFGAKKIKFTKNAFITRETSKRFNCLEIIKLDYFGCDSFCFSSVFPNGLIESKF